MSTWLTIESENAEGSSDVWTKSLTGMQECVFKKCCKNYKKNGKHCKKCPKK